jgi:hypothetical protein
MVRHETQRLSTVPSDRIADSFGGDLEDSQRQIALREPGAWPSDRSP